MIVGLGLDVVELSRMQRSWERFGMRIAKRILCPEELRCLQKPETRFLASRFAAKEAAVKALGTGFSQGITLVDIAVRQLPSGQPQLVLFNRAAARCAGMGVRRMHLSITHGKEIAAAVVILET